MTDREIKLLKIFITILIFSTLVLLLNAYLGGIVSGLNRIDTLNKQLSQWIGRKNTIPNYNDLDNIKSKNIEMRHLINKTKEESNDSVNQIDISQVLKKQFHSSGFLIKEISIDKEKEVRFVATGKIYALVNIMDSIKKIPGLFGVKSLVLFNDRPGSSILVEVTFSYE